MSVSAIRHLQRCSFNDRRFRDPMHEREYGAVSNRASKAGARRFSRLRRMFRFATLAVAILASALSAAQTSPKKILILSSFSDRGDYSGLNLLKSSLQKALPWAIDFDVEFLGGRRFDEKGYEEVLTKSLKHTYAKANLDLVVIISYTGLEFAERHHDELFPGAPILFMDVDPDQIAGRKLAPEVTGVTSTAGIRETIDLALHLHPDTSTVAIISSDSTPDRYFLKRVHAELLRYQDKVRVVDLVGLPTNQLMESVAALPSQTIVLFDLAPQESVQPAMGVNEILAIVAGRLPTYSIFPGDVLNRGGVGGVGYDWGPELSLVSSAAKRILSGERPESIPVAAYSGLHPILDWRQLERWHIPESALPADSTILYRPPSFWERDRQYIIAAVVLIFAQSVLIVGLLRQRARKRKAEAVLRESEKRFRVMADTTPSLIWMCDPLGKVTYLNHTRLQFTGADPNTDYGNSWTEYVHPGDLKRVLEAVASGVKTHRSFSSEYRLRRHDGVYRWMFDVASPRLNGDRSFAGFIGSAIDVSDQKLAQEALENVSGRLIEAQEKERTRIARDLHDDICQRLALLSMELEQANRNGASQSTKKKLEEIRQHCSEIADDVQSLSHQLHSSKLDYLGIAAAIRGFCREFANQHELKIQFTDENVPTHLPRDISLCLFRVAQEALQNAVKYSGTKEFSVELRGTATEVELTVTDSGAGFDLEEAKRDRGLGLVSMQERVHLVRGWFGIESSPGAGTRVKVVVPAGVENETFPGQDANALGASVGMV